MVTLNDVLPERRATAFIPQCPLDVVQRRGRREGIKLLKRTTTHWEHFDVDSETGAFSVVIGARPSCSCSDPVTICEHVSYIYLDVLKLDSTNPITWQTSLLSNDLARLFPDSPGAKSIRSPSPPPALSAKREIPLPPISTSGLTDPSVRQVLLYALQIHPEAVAAQVEKRRFTPLDALSAGQVREVLEIVGGEYEDVGALVNRKIALDNERVESFRDEVQRAEAAMTSLDEVSARWQVERSREVSAGVSKAVDTILKRVNMQSAKGTKIAAVEALVSIGRFMLNTMDGHIVKCVRNNGTASEIGGAVEKIVGFMQEADVLPLLEELKQLDATLQERC